MLALSSPHRFTLHGGSLSTAAASLTSLGSKHLCRGELTDAMACFEAAQAVLSSPESYRPSTVAAARIQSGLLSSNADAIPQTDTPLHLPPDLYEEEECDVGPRMLGTPIATDSYADEKDVTLLKAVVSFNKGLVYHAMGNIPDAKDLYEVVIYSVQNMLCYTAESPSRTFMELAMRAHNNLGVVSYHEGQEGVAAASFEAATQFARHLVPLSQAFRLEHATALSNFCRVNWMRGDVGENMYASLEEILRIRTAALPWDHPDVAAAHYNIAVAESARHNAPTAIAHLVQYLAIAKYRSDQKNLKDLDSVPALIFLLLIQNEGKDTQLSQDLVRGLRALQDKRQELGPDGLEAATVLNYVGTLLFYQHDYENALVFFQEELRLEDIKESSVTKSSEGPPSGETNSVSVTCNNIGRILQELGKLRDAIAYYHRALEPEYGDVEKASRPNSKCTASYSRSKEYVHPKCPSSSINLYSTVWYNLGLIHDKLGSYGEAIHAFEMSLNLRKVLLGCNHSDIACLLYNIGVLLMEQQRLDEASASFREALCIRRIAAPGQLNDRHIVKTLEKLTSLHKDNGNLQGALEVALEVLSVQEVSTEYDPLSRHKEMGATLRSISELHHSAGSLDQAVNFAMDSVDKLRVAAEYSIQQHILNCDTQLEAILIQERIASVEQLVSSLLLLGSLHHETSEPLQAQSVLREASVIVQLTSMATRLCTLVTAPSSLHALQEVTMMLGTCQCAPVA
jgi:tetratricopeptide (TPR) repeat protein